MTSSNHCTDFIFWHKIWKWKGGDPQQLLSRSTVIIWFLSKKVPIGFPKNGFIMSWYREQWEIKWSSQGTFRLIHLCSLTSSTLHSLKDVSELPNKLDGSADPNLRLIHYENILGSSAEAITQFTHWDSWWESGEQLMSNFNLGLMESESQWEGYPNILDPAWITCNSTKLKDQPPGMHCGWSNAWQFHCFCRPRQVKYIYHVPMEYLHRCHCL